LQAFSASATNMIELINILDEVFYGDELWLRLSAHENSQNSRIRNAETAHTFDERP
jgi:hypothetical protein